MSTGGQMTHDAIRDALPECALGILDGRERAMVMGHVESCESCAEELLTLTTTADSLVHLPVAVDPPLGFESRVMERITRSSAPVIERRRRILQWAAALALVAGAIGAGWAVGRTVAGGPPAKSADAPVIERSLVAGQRTVGSVWVDTGPTSWMFVSLDLPGATATVRCEIVTTSGHRDLVGTYALETGHAAWGTALSVPWSSVKTVEITSASGARLATLAATSWPGTARAPAN
ncbi:MAG: zf-HC2 domain-containing protein [Acidobacteriota bacterium]|nr:zf-HC2 domain-containing protein [Acidobacteriota bacterium]